MVVRLGLLLQEIWAPSNIRVDRIHSLKQVVHLLNASFP